VIWYFQQFMINSIVSCFVMMYVQVISLSSWYYCRNFVHPFLPDHNLWKGCLWFVTRCATWVFGSLHEKPLLYKNQMLSEKPHYLLANSSAIFWNFFVHVWFIITNLLWYHENMERLSRVILDSQGSYNFCRRSYFCQWYVESRSYKNWLMQKPIIKYS